MAARRAKKWEGGPRCPPSQAPGRNQRPGAGATTTSTRRLRGSAIPSGVSTLGRVQQDQRQRAKDYLSHVADRFARPNLTVKKVVQIGHPPDTIVDTAQRLGVKAIVMSTHGRTGLSRWLYGSVTWKVLAAAPCPVLVIPSRVMH